MIDILQIFYKKTKIEIFYKTATMERVAVWIEIYIERIFHGIAS